MMLLRSERRVSASPPPLPSRAFSTQPTRVIRPLLVGSAAAAAEEAAAAEGGGGSSKNLDPKIRKFLWFFGSACTYFCSQAMRSDVVDAAANDWKFCGE